MQQRAERFHAMRPSGSLWAVGAIHGQLNRLMALHDLLAERFRAGDRLVYLGNMIGRGPDSRAVLDEILDLRRHLIAQHGVFAADVGFVRGGQEEMWHKLLQLAFAPAPAEILDWMLDHGLSPVLEGYGIDPREARRVVRDGPVGLSRWTAEVRTTLRRHDGHETLLNGVRRAVLVQRRDPARAQPAVAHVADLRTVGALALAAAPLVGRPPPPSPAECVPGPLCVAAGVDLRRPLGAQGDAFWWGAPGFDGIGQPVEGHRPVIRGFDPTGGGYAADPFKVTLDGNGPILLGRFEPDGTFVEVFEG